MSEFKSQRSESTNTPEVRIAYPFLHEKRTKRANGMAIKTPRFDMTLIVPKLSNDPAQCANYMFFWNLINQAAAKSWGAFPQGGHIPIQDGDAPLKPKAPSMPGQAVTAPKEYPWRKGSWIIEVTHYLDPGPRVCVVKNDQQMEIPARVINGETMYKSGDYGIAHVHAYTFQNEKFGVNIGFEGVLFTRPGEAIGSSGPKSASQMFGTMAQAAPVASPPTAPAAQPPMPPTGAAPAPVAPVYQGTVGAPPAAPVAPGQVGLPPLPPVPGR